jgi:hypothetical protein
MTNTKQNSLPKIEIAAEDGINYFFRDAFSVTQDAQKLTERLKSLTDCYSLSVGSRWRKDFKIEPLYGILNAIKDCSDDLLQLLSNEMERGY